jgi:hypothetical protein
MIGTSGQYKLREALGLIQDGGSIAEAERATGVHRLTIEKALRQTIDRQTAIRTHLQSRAGLSSLLRYPERGPWGDSGYMGNCSGYVLVDLIDYAKPASVFDPMEGSGTTGDVCFDFNVSYAGRDLRVGWDLLSGDLPSQEFDLIFWHPPYWPGFRYSNHPNDFSAAKSVKDYLERVQVGLTRLGGLLSAGGRLALLIGDGRKNGQFYPIHSDIIGWNVLPLEATLIKEGDHTRRARHFRYGPSAFIPTLHEYVLLFKKGQSCKSHCTPA